MAAAPFIERRKAEPVAESFDEELEDYFPMFWSSVQAALLAVVSQILTSVYFAMQYGAALELRVWRNVLPYMAMGVEPDRFRMIVMLSSITSAVILACFSLWAFVWRHRLQVQAGRLFAWINLALIGILNLVRVHFFDDFAQAERWMWALPVIGIVGFGVGSVFIWIDYDDRRQHQDR